LLARVFHYICIRTIVSCLIWSSGCKRLRELSFFSLQDRTSVWNLGLHGLADQLSQLSSSTPLPNSTEPGILGLIHFGQPRLRPLNMKYPILATVRQISGHMTVSKSSTRFLLAALDWRVKTKCSCSRLVRLSS